VRDAAAVGRHEEVGITSGFPYEILDDVWHRPWPMPDRAWIMKLSWHDVLFAHWPVDPQAIAPLVPSQLPIDVHDGAAWVGVIPFHMTNVAPRGVPALPFVSAFPEINVRTYVTLAGKPGVYFFSLDAGSAVAAAAARALFGLPYFTATIEVTAEAGTIDYVSRRHATGARIAEFRAGYKPLSPVASEPGSLEYFLTERYCLYTVNNGSPRLLDIHHPKWPLQTAEARIDMNTMARASGIELPPERPLLHYASRQDMVAWGMVDA
jgi:uncharacterized protein YqjF (DUF2071 family)